MYQSTHLMQFGEVIQLIQQARNKAYKAVNKELIDLYCEKNRIIQKRVTIGNI